MSIRKINYALKTDRGVFSILKRNAIIVGDDSGYAEFNMSLDVQDYIKQRKIAFLNRKDYQDETGALDETKVSDFYGGHYARLQEIAVPWELDLVLKNHDPRPVSYDGKLHEVIQAITVNDPNHTPDVVPAHYREIQAPGVRGYPLWKDPTSTEYYNKGNRMTYTDGLNYESLINTNTYSPEEYTAGWKVI